MKKVKESILQKKKECYICHSTFGLHKHHIFPGPNRQTSDDNGFWVWLRFDWHNMSDYGVHFNKALDLKIKQDCQREFEKTHTREEFMRLIGKNYL